MKSIQSSCLVIFSGNCSSFSIKLAKKLSNFIDCYILSYKEFGEREVVNHKSYCHVTVTKESLSDFFSDCKPKFNEKNWKIMPGNLDLAQLLFCENFSQYDYYWFCEDDVRYTGNWLALLQSLESVDSDLIATNFRNIPLNWAHLESFISPINYMPQHTIFLPFFRISKRGASSIIEAYRHSWSGHHEISWPAILSYNNFKVTDICEHNNRIYTSTPENIGMGPGSFIYEPSKLFTGLRKDTLYHPVKEFSVYYKRRLKGPFYRFKYNFFEFVKRFF